MSKKEETKKAPVIALVPGATIKFRANSARAVWYEFLTTQVGKTQAEFIENATKKVPSTPKKGKLAEKLEPPQGWLSFFERGGYCTIK